MSDPGNKEDANIRSSVLDRQSLEALLQQYSSIPSTASTSSVENFLQSTLSDLQARKEVESSLKDLVKDVEFAVNLQEQLSSQTHQNQAERIIAQQELALQETHVVEKDRLSSQTLMADALVKDLWSLSKEVGSLLELKQKHEAMILEYDELTAKLAQAEEDLRAARSRPQPQPEATKIAPQPTAEQPTTQSSEVEQKPAAQPTTQKPPPPEAAPPEAALQSLASATVAKIPEKDPPQKAQEKSEPPEKPAGTMVAIPPAAAQTEDAEDAGQKPQTESAASAPVVALIEDDQDGAARTTLENIDMEILMRIFGFLEAYDILNTAQVNISMYSRVDSLFGFGMEPPTGTQDDAVSTTSTLATTPTVAAATQQSGTATTASLSSGTTSKSATKPGSAAKPAEPQFGHRLVGGGRNLLNMLQGGGKNDGNSAIGADPSKRQQSPKRRGAGGAGRARGGSDAGDSKPPLSEAMAHSMAAKLNDSEINAIISMTEKLRSKEKQVSLLIREKEEIEGKLNGSEAVKDFLITKVRDMEKIMNKSDETEKKVTQQIASDQEVIAFLDGRVQELERMTRLIQKEKNATQEKLKSVVAQNDKKVAVLSDMLQFERQKLKENEREWKATKKLLVKEVKGCRAQIVNLQAERDGFREQNDALRKAVMAGGSSANGGSR